MKIRSLSLLRINSLISRSLYLTSLILALSSVPKFSSSQTNIGGIVNTYWPVISFDMCNNRVALPMIVVGVNIGDKMLLMQMEGADIDTTNTASYGTVNGYGGAGNYELLTVLDVTNNIVTFEETILKTYDVNKAVQLILVPQYVDVNIAGPLSAQPWNGSSGGVAAFIASGSVTMNADIDVSALGFPGGSVLSDNSCYGGGAGFDGYLGLPVDEVGANKGDGIAGLLYQNLARGAPANGGGGGNDSNTGGGGGSNGAGGGQGGQRVNDSLGCAGDFPGIGGYALNYANGVDQIYLGGGGGAGDDNSNGGTAGGNGGGIVIIRAASLTGNNFNILAHGSDVATLATYDGAGGGGGGGAVLLDIANVNTVTVSVNGGIGGSVDNGTSGVDSCFGPGGGGGAGMIWVSGGSLPPVTLETLGGASGTTTGPSCSGTTNGALPGSDSSPLTGLLIPESTQLFVPLTMQVFYDSVVCVNTAAALSVVATGTGILTYEWSNGATTDTTTVYPSAQTTYEITVTDSRGCSLTQDFTVDVKKDTVWARAFPDSIVKGWEPVQLKADTVGNEFFSWSPGQFLSDSTIFNPIANPIDTTTFCVTAIGYNGCIDTACVTVYVVVPEPAIFIPTAITPNNDGINDTWHIIVNNTCYTIEEVKVWNRWGMMIYDLHVSPGEWNGTYNGAPQPMETYFYYILASCTSKLGKDGKPVQEKFVGNVTVIR